MQVSVRIARSVVIGIVSTLLPLSLIQCTTTTTPAPEVTGTSESKYGYYGGSEYWSGRDCIGYCTEGTGPDGVQCSHWSPAQYPLSESDTTKQTTSCELLLRYFANQCMTGQQVHVCPSNDGMGSSGSSGTTTKPTWDTCGAVNVRVKEGRWKVEPTDLGHQAASGNLLPPFGQEGPSIKESYCRTNSPRYELDMDMFCPGEDPSSKVNSDNWCKSDPTRRWIHSKGTLPKAQQEAKRDNLAEFVCASNFAAASLSTAAGFGAGPVAPLAVASGAAWMANAIGGCMQGGTPGTIDKWDSDAEIAKPGMSMAGPRHNTERWFTYCQRKIKFRWVAQCTATPYVVSGYEGETITDLDTVEGARWKPTDGDFSEEFGEPCITQEFMQDPNNPNNMIMKPGEEWKLEPHPLNGNIQGWITADKVTKTGCCGSDGKKCDCAVNADGQEQDYCKSTGYPGSSGSSGYPGSSGSSGYPGSSGSSGSSGYPGSSGSSGYPGY